MTTEPTLDQIQCLTGAFDYFNGRLFAGSLPPVMLTFSRRKGSAGVFYAEKWEPAYCVDPANRDELLVIEARVGYAGGLHEIALNPNSSDRPIEELMSTLVHEMVHLWQQVAGEPPRRCYHDREWSGRMRQVGLHPSSTGDVGGAEVGQKMSHYVEPNGAFRAAFATMPPSLTLPFRARPERKPKTKNGKGSKQKYTCPDCSANAWAKPGLRLWCHGQDQKPTLDIDAHVQRLQDDDAEHEALMLPGELTP